MKLLTTGEVAHRLDRSTEQVRRYEKAGLLRATRTARGYRIFSVEDVERFRRHLRKPRPAQLAGYLAPKWVQVARYGKVQPRRWPEPVVEAVERFWADHPAGKAIHSIVKAYGR